MAEGGGDYGEEAGDDGGGKIPEDDLNDVPDEISNEQPDGLFEESLDDNSGELPNKDPFDELPEEDPNKQLNEDPFDEYPEEDPNEQPNDDPFDEFPGEDPNEQPNNDPFDEFPDEDPNEQPNDDPFDEFPDKDPNEQPNDDPFDEFPDEDPNEQPNDDPFDEFPDEDPDEQPNKDPFDQHPDEIVDEVHEELRGEEKNSEESAEEINLSVETENIGTDQSTITLQQESQEPFSRDEEGNIILDADTMEFFGEHVSSQEEMEVDILEEEMEELFNSYEELGLEQEEGLATSHDSAQDSFQDQHELEPEIHRQQQEVTTNQKIEQTQEQELNREPSQKSKKDLSQTPTENKMDPLIEQGEKEKLQEFSQKRIQEIKQELAQEKKRSHDQDQEIEQESIQEVHQNLKEDDRKERYKHETGRRPFYAGKETKGFIEWKDYLKQQKEDYAEKKSILYEKEKESNEQSKEIRKSKDEWVQYLANCIKKSEFTEVTREKLNQFLEKYETLRELLEKLKTKEISEEEYEKEVKEFEQMLIEKSYIARPLFMNFDWFRRYYNETIRKSGKRVANLYISKKTREFLSYISGRIKQLENRGNLYENAEKFEKYLKKSFHVREKWALLLNNLIHEVPNEEISGNAKKELETVIKRYCEIRAIIFSRNILKENKEKLIQRRIEKGNRRFFELFEILKRFLGIYDNYSRNWMEQSLILEGKKTIRQLSQKLENIEQKLARGGSDYDLFEEFLHYIHRIQLIKQLVTEFNNSGNWIKNLRPTKTFIIFLKEKQKQLVNSSKDDKTNSIKDQIKVLLNFSDLIIKIRENDIITKVIRASILENPGKYNAYDIEKWLLITDASARDQLKRMFTEDEYQQYIRTQKHVSIDTIMKIAEKRGGKCHTKALKNAKSKLHLECAEGHHFFTTYNSVVYTNTWCPDCNLYVSETICRRFFEEIFKRSFPKSYPEWLTNENGNQMELDGYSRDLGLAFEYQGIQHRKKAFGMTDEELQNIQREDALKLKKCGENHVVLLQIPDDEIVPYDKMQVYIENEYEKKTGKRLKNIPRYDYQEFTIYENKYAKKFREHVEDRGGALMTPYFSARKEITIMCEKGHQWTTTPDSIYRDNWCSKCAGNMKGTTEYFRKLGKEFNCDLISDYINAKKPLWYKCPKGHKFKKSPYWLKKDYKKIEKFCPECKMDIYAEKFQDFVSKKKGHLLTPYKGRFKPIKIKCKNNHVWETTPGAVYQGNWCKDCKK